MNKLFFTLLLLSFCRLNAQYGTLNAILEKLEARKGVNQEVLNESIDGKKFVNIKEFDDHTERNFVIINDKSTTYVEVFDDKSNNESTSKVFSGDVVRKKNMVSIRCDLLEGKKIPVAVTKTFFLTKQDDIMYMIDINSRERWIDESSYGKGKQQKRKK